MTESEPANHLALVTAVLSFLTFAGLYYITPSDILLICLAVGAITAGYTLLTVVLAKRASDTSVTLALATSTFTFTFVVFGPLVLGALAYYRTSLTLLSIILLIALAYVSFYYCLFVPLALYYQYYRRPAETRAEPPYPSVSVIIPAYDESGYVGGCIEAVLESNYPEDALEIVVVDDGSTDDTYEEAMAYEDDVTVVSKRNGGKHSALNYGLLYATGDIVVTVDADSLIERTAISKLVGTFQENPDVGAVAGNVKVRNRDRILTKIQALEYIVSIGIVMRAFDICDAVMIVPGALGGYRRDVLERGGFYDSDTLTEDFDVTVKVLKQGRVVRANDARAYSETPATWTDLYNQRLRWYRGNFMTILKHGNVFTNSRFGVLHALSFPLTLFSMFFIPVAGLVVIASIIAGLLAGRGAELAAIFGLFTLMQVLLAVLTLQLEGEDLRLAAYAPFFIVGYRQFCDLLTMRSIVDVLSKRNLQWTSARRVMNVEDD